MHAVFDAMRLQIIMLQKKEAKNAIGKSSDYFFCRGEDYINSQEYSNAIKSFQ